MYFCQCDSHQNDGNNVIDITTEEQINFQNFAYFL